MTRWSALRALAWATLAALLLALWGGWITTTPAKADGEQNLQMALSLAHRGVISTGAAGARPDMFREPLPAFSGAAIIRGVEAFKGRTADDAWASGERVRWLKTQNLLWLALVSLAVFGAARTLGVSRAGALTALALVNVAAFGLRREFVDSLGTDLAGAALLTTAAGLLTKGWVSGRWRWWLAAGTAFGLAILVKASLLYVVIGLAVSLTVLAAWRKHGWPGNNRGVAVILLLLSTAAVITPWSERNARLFGTRAITDRGGEVLLLRAYEDQVSPDEYRGVWCVYAPSRLRPSICRLTGWTGADLQPGGALGRFSRAQPRDPAVVRRAAEAGTGPAPGLSFYRTAKARYQVLVERNAGGTAPLTAADAAAKAEALALIKARPDLHLLMTPAYLWRGLGGLTAWLGLAAAIALLRRRDDLAVFLLPAVGLGLFLALFSHFIPRYAWPMIPFACVTLPLILETALQKVRPPGRPPGALRS